MTSDTLSTQMWTSWTEGNNKNNDSFPKDHPNLLGVWTSPPLKSFPKVGVIPKAYYLFGMNGFTFGHTLSLSNFKLGPSRSRETVLLGLLLRTPIYIYMQYVCYVYLQYVYSIYTRCNYYIILMSKGSFKRIMLSFDWLLEAQTLALSCTSMANPRPPPGSKQFTQWHLLCARKCDITKPFNTASWRESTTTNWSIHQEILIELERWKV